MKRKMVTVLLAGLLTAQSVFPAFAEELAVPEMAAANVETEAQTAEESQPAQTEAEAVTEQQAVQTESEAATEQTAQTETEAAVEQQSAQTEAPDVDVLDSIGEDEEELIISSENGSGETVDLDELEAGLMTASDTEGGGLTEHDFADLDFWEYLYNKYDNNEDYELNEEEISAIVDLNLSDANLYSIEKLDDIRYLTSLKTLICGNYVKNIISLDVSGNTALTYLDCSGIGLFELNVSGNTNLETLICDNNGLYDLDVSKNTALRKLDCAYNYLKKLDVSKNAVLTYLNCSGIDSLEVNVSGNTNLETLICNHNELFDLDVSKNTALKNLDCAYNHLKKLDVSKNTALEELNCEENELLELDVSQNDKLMSCNTEYQHKVCYAELISNENEKEFHLNLKELFGDIDYQLYTFFAPDQGVGHEIVYPQNDILRVPYDSDVIVTCERSLGKNDFKLGVSLRLQKKDETLIPIDEDHFPDPNFRRELYLAQSDWTQDEFLSKDEIQSLTDLNVEEKGIESLTGIKYLTALTGLSCSNNQLTNLDVSKNTALTDLSCRNNQLTNLDVSNNTALMSLWCGGNQLTSLNVRQNTALKDLNCEKNQLNSLDVTENEFLTFLYCNNNKLTELDVSCNPSLMVINCSNNNLTNLDVSANRDLGGLFCAHNQLTNLDVNNNTALSDLECSYNNLTNLDVKKNIALVWLYCDSNQLTSLDVSNNTSLDALKCSNNNLTSLDVSNGTSLDSLQCSGNNLAYLDLTNMNRLTYLLCNIQKRETYATRSDGVLKVDIGALVGAENINRVSFEPEAGYEIRYADGIAEIVTDSLPGYITYEYDTKLPRNLDERYMTVEVKLKRCEDGKHTFGDWIIKEEPSYTSSGRKVRICSTCGFLEEEILEPLKSAITFFQEEDSFKIGDVILLVGYLMNIPENDPIISWESSNSKVASVDANGTATATDIGVADITVTTESGASATIRLNVYCGSLDEPDHAYEEVIERWPTCTWDGRAYQQCKDCGKIGSERVLPATGHQFGAYRITKEETIFETGLEESTCSVCGTTSTRVRPKLEPEVQVTEEEISLQIGKTASLETYVTGLQKGDAISAWESDNTGVVSVDENGRATANEVGTAVITVTTKGGVSKKITVRVYCGSAEEPDHTYEEVIEQAATCTEDGKAYQKCTVCGKKKEGSDRVIKAAGHQFGPYEVVTEATVFKSGLEESVCAVCKEKRTQILPRLEAAVRYSQEGLTIQLGETVSVKGYVTGIQNGDFITRWRSFAPNIAKVDADGNVTAMRAGLAYIAVGTRAGAVAKLLVTVEDHTVHTTGISNLHTGLKLEAGKSIALHPVIEPADSQDPVIYGSVAPNIATVSKDGVIKAIRVGLANIYVKSGTEYRKILVRVIAPSLTAITGVRKTGSLYEGVTYQLRPQRYPLGSAGVFYYNSSDPEIASVDKDGKITAKKKGFTTITVTARGVSAAMRLRVK